MLIGLNGRLGAGKDTAANLLSAMLEQDYEVRTTAFARKLKLMGANIWGLTLEELEALKLDPGYTFQVVKPDGTVIMLTGRQFLERLGTEAGREVLGQTIWLDQALPAGLDHADEVLIFTDCRFPNEAARIHECGGVVVEVIGPNGRQGNGHPSDTPLFDNEIDFFIDNAVRDDDHRNLTNQLKRLLVSIALLDGVTL